MKHYVLAVDLGGTNLRVAAVDDAGKILHIARKPTPRSGDGKAIVNSIFSLADECRNELKNDGRPIAAGTAIPATLDLKLGKILRAPNLPELDGFELVREVAGVLELPVVLENDATSAAIGENWLGASRTVDSSVCITLGTGVGGGIIIDSKPLRGLDGTAGEVGHLCVEPLGVECGCGSNGCLEQYSSASAVVRMVKEGLPLHKDSTLHSVAPLTALDVYKAGKTGDVLAHEVFAKMGYYLGIAMAGLINVLNPEMVVLGGGLSSGWDLFIDRVRKQVATRAFAEPARRARIVRAELGDYAGLIGAARIALEVGRT